MQSATGQTLTYGYDGLRRLTTVDTSLYEKSYTYRNLEDSRTTGQVSSVTYDLPTDQSFAYEYDDMGNIDTYTDANGTVTYTYDDLGQLLSASNGYTYSYDNAGNILSANGHTYTYGDSTWADLLTAVDGETITYDAIGNPTSYYNGTRWSFDWTRGRQLASAENNNVRIDYTYDADGLRTSKTVTSPLDNSQKNGLFVDSDGETRYYVDGVAAYAGLVYWDGYFYYFNSSLKAVRNRTYWPTNTNGLIPVAEYTFDENGRITNPPVVGIDAQGQLKNGIYADADGEIRYYVDGIATYAKLVYCNGHYYYIDSSLKAVRDTTYQVTETNGLMAAGNYTFDAQGRMVNPPEDALTEAISTFALTGETMSKTYDYVYASGTLMRQVLTVTIGNSTTTYAMDFFYDASGYPFAVKYNGDLCYYITNLQGDVMSIVDAQGEIVAEYEYDPYGNILAATGPLAEANPLRYRGYVFDTETQFYYLQSRYYDPELGRFINADALVSTGQGVLGNNMFAYCLNNPVNLSDPSGGFCGGVIGWGFGYLRDRYKQYKAELFEDNYSHNSAIDADPNTTTRNRIINDQNGTTGDSFQYGEYNASYNGCEAIAIHNSMVLLGRDSTLSETIRDCQLAGAMPLNGVFGTDPRAIGNVLNLYGVSYTNVALDEMNQPGVYIISFWNSDNISDGLHTVAVYYDGAQYTTYNLSGYGKEYAGLPNCGDRYICGYFLGDKE